MANYGATTDKWTRNGQTLAWATSELYTGDYLEFWDAGDWTSGTINVQVYTNAFTTVTAIGKPGNFRGGDGGGLENIKLILILVAVGIGLLLLLAIFWWCCKRKKAKELRLRDALPGEGGKSYGVGV